MFRRKLCPRCKTGKYTYELDKNSPECPYLSCCKGRKCSMYQKLEKPKKHAFFKFTHRNDETPQIPPK